MPASAPSISHVGIRRPASLRRSCGRGARCPKIDWRYLSRVSAGARLGSLACPAVLAGGGPPGSRVSSLQARAVWIHFNRSSPSASAAKVEALSRKSGHVGAIAFSRTGDPSSGDVSDAKLIRKFVEVPDDLSALWGGSLLDEAAPDLARVVAYEVCLCLCKPPDSSAPFVQSPFPRALFPS